MLDSQETLQPFKCSVCSRRFTRLENLKRHSALHRKSTERTIHRCSKCTATFSRADLKRRHIAKKHGETWQGQSQSQSQSQSSTTTRTDSERSETPREFGASTSSNVVDPIGSANHQSDTDTTTMHNNIAASSTDSMGLEPTIRFDFETGWSPFDIERLVEGTSTSNGMGTGSGSGTGTGTGMGTGTGKNQPFDQRPSPPRQSSNINIPTITHRGSIGSASVNSFEIHRQLSQSPLSSFGGRWNEMDILQDSGLMENGLRSFFMYASHMFPFVHRPTFDQHSCHPSLLLGMMCIGLHVSSDGLTERQRAMHCYLAGRRLLDEMLDITQARSADTLAVIQAHLLFEKYAIMALCGEHTPQGLRLHYQCVELARKAGLMESYPTRPSNTQDLDSLWRQFIRTEGHKRTCYGTYILDSTWYQILSRPRCLSHLEIKHELPCSDDLWEAPNASEWAHRMLLANDFSSSKPRVRFIDAVRNSLASVPSLSPQLDTFGAQLMTHFILSSVREISGWTTMTGRSCFERFEALHASMTRLENLVTVSDPANETPASASAEATWRMSMTELLLWSQSHTGGLVENSIDAALAAITMLGAKHRVDLSPQIIESVEPHLTWFLLYLQRTVDTRFEPPFLIFYAFKAAVMAWQIARLGGSSLPSMVGVLDADGLLLWIREIFAKRTRWGIGKLALESLEELSSSDQLVV
nr:uncharacterized protein CI109_004418 [Kwoniella shandongensis]KAA5527127.1 hypothetical protein CI109_004418 [Kwoniella shandongensis]